MQETPATETAETEETPLPCTATTIRLSPDAVPSGTEVKDLGDVGLLTDAVPPTGKETCAGATPDFMNGSAVKSIREHSLR